MAAPRLQCRAQCKKQNGALFFGPKEFSWTADGKPQPDLRVPYTTVKACAQNKSEKVILKITQAAHNGSPETSHVFTFPPPNAHESRESVKAVLADVMKENTATVAASKDTAEEFQIRLEILNANAELRELHKSLVVSGVVSEDDFWASRRHYIVYQKFVRNQRRGPSGTIVDVRPQQADAGGGSAPANGSGSDMTFKFTDNVVTSLLAQFPPVRRAYDATVATGKMTKQEFFRRFVESKYYQRGRPGSNNSSTNPGAVASNEFFETYENEDDDDYALHPKKARFERRNMLLDLGAVDAESGNRPDATMRAGGVRASLPLIRQFNRVSEGVLRATTGAGAAGSGAKRGDSPAIGGVGVNTAAAPAGAKSGNDNTNNDEVPADTLYARATELEDLRIEAEADAKPLQIGDVSAYFHSAPTEGRGAGRGGDAKTLGGQMRFQAGVAAWQCSLAETKIDRAHADTVLAQLNILTRKRRRDYQRATSTAPPNKQAAALHLGAIELLRTFWTSRSEASFDEGKMAGVLAALADVGKKADALERADPACRPLLQAMRAALARAAAVST
ncbi:RNA polymerase II transcription factor B subunit 1 [Geranomyces variabilis]|uniref:RNA polymerase II transcription factor B subunit 1 n=1 Tax=Geranomyces variabilis TaxID=109894 RepID=A0AAD5TF37_9FUNG|nr:RNA polymerase II transcription factor B subunit 1 [Geranomyces variabilis]